MLSEISQTSHVLSHLWNLVLKNEGQEYKTGSVWEWIPAGIGKAKGKYVGR
jgi:hypothetical protein